MKKKTSRSFLALVGAVGLSVFLGGCNGGVEAFSAVVAQPDGDTAIELRDLQRRPADEEAVVSSAAEETVRFRLDEEILGATSVRSLVLDVETTEDRIDGSVALRLATPDDGEAVAYQFAGATAVGTGVSRSVTLRFDLTRPMPNLTVASLAGAEMEFGSAHGAYRIRSVAFETDPPQPMIRFGPDGGAVLVDDRLPVTVGPGRWSIGGADRLVAMETDAVRLEYRTDPALFSDRSVPPTAVIELEDRSGTVTRLRTHLRPGRHRVVFRPMLWGAAPVAVRVADAPSGFALLEVGGVDTPGDAGPEAVPVPLPVEMGELLSYPRRLWRREGFEVFSWSLYPEVLWVDSRDYATQARMFRRLAFFVEKEGYQGTLLTNDVLAGLHGWNAHNYNPDGLAAFFNAAAEQAFPLNEEERTLLAIAVNNGVIERSEAGTFVPGNGGILAISQESYPALRRLLLIHEAMHGVFYAETAFRDGVFRYWEEAMTTEERGFWRLFFGWMSYSPEDTYLMVNEMQAYLLQQREVAIRWYFRSRTADRLRSALPGRSAAIDGFLADHPDTFVRAGAEINRLLFQEAGMVGGEPFCLELISAEE